MEYNLIVNNETKAVECETGDTNSINATIGDSEYAVDYALISAQQIYLSVNGRGMNSFVLDTPDGKCIIINGTQYLVQDEDILNQSTSRKKGGSDLPTEITPVTPSVVVTVLVNEGDKVEKGQGIIVLSAMKMETTLSAAFNGTVTAVNAAEGDKVAPGDILVDIEKDETAEEEE